MSTAEAFVAKLDIVCIIIGQSVMQGNQFALISQYDNFYCIL